MQHLTQLCNFSPEIAEEPRRCSFVSRTRRSVWEERFRKMEGLRRKGKMRVAPVRSCNAVGCYDLFNFFFPLLPAHVSSCSSKLFLVLLIVVRVRDALPRLSRKVDLLGLRYPAKARSLFPPFAKRGNERGRKQENKGLLEPVTYLSNWKIALTTFIQK